MCDIRVIAIKKGKQDNRSNVFFIQQTYRKFMGNMKKKSRGSKITTNTYFTRLQQALKLKIAPLFAPLINLLKQT